MSQPIFHVVAHRSDSSMFGRVSAPMNKLDGSVWEFQSRAGAHAYMDSLPCGHPSEELSYTVEEAGAEGGAL